MKGGKFTPPEETTVKKTSLIRVKKRKQIKRWVNKGSEFYNRSIKSWSEK